MADISLWLDYYTDIYSDFDSRHYLKRRISDDFLYELKMASKHKEGIMENLLLLLSKEKREEESEKLITESLESYFQKQFITLRELGRKKLLRGIILFVTGITVMITNSLIAYSGNDSFPLVALRIMLEPAGWFLVWAAFDFLFYDWQELKKEKKFYRELAEANVRFLSS